jgi:hypothetical protein
MTMKQPRFSGPDPITREVAKKDRACTIAIQALCRGAFDWRVQGVTGAAARKGRAHIALRYGRVLLYLEDRAALETLVDAVEAAYELREEVFGVEPGSSMQRGQMAHSGFERDGKPSVAAGA